MNKNCTKPTDKTAFTAGNGKLSPATKEILRGPKMNYHI